jgi:hypothetical protein
MSFPQTQISSIREPIPPVKYLTFRQISRRYSLSYDTDRRRNGGPVDVLAHHEIGQVKASLKSIKNRASCACGEGIPFLFTLPRSIKRGDYL